MLKSTCKNTKMKQKPVKKTFKKTKLRKEFWSSATHTYTKIFPPPGQTTDSLLVKVDTLQNLPYPS